jgi:hypothetical protein
MEAIVKPSLAAFDLTCCLLHFNLQDLGMQLLYAQGAGLQPMDVDLWNCHLSMPSVCDHKCQ